ncbi:leucine-rich repeat domain-containing protein [Simiduia aestuariiviva]|uniref:Internalin A n=1 Tax=Simiduia aestuariiviva TaxID=1510459 RepID=A0A839UG78_9GAMM|nr:hypothetical protein [Simiduia aestuariiviva]MBB3167054.1 internalin A [Simiduia aestuariiviva]
MQKSSAIIFLAAAGVVFTLGKCTSGPAPSEVAAESEASQRYAELKAERLARQNQQGDLSGAMQRLDELGLADASLYRCVKKSVSQALATTTQHTMSQPTDLRRLECRKQGIRRVTGLEHFTQLEKLDLTGNSIADVAPIGKLYQLRELILNDNKVSSIWPLLNLDKLTKLGLRNNPVQDLHYVGGFDQLGSLDFRLTSQQRCDYLVDIKSALKRSKVKLSVPSRCKDEFGEPASISEFE